MPDPEIDPNTGNQPPGQSDWKAGLPEELKGEKSLETFKDVAGLAKSYVEAQKMIGGSVRIPKEDAKPEDWSTFYAKLGRPEKAEDYNFVLPKELPAGVAINQDLLNGFMKTAHSLGLSKKQAEGFFNWYNTYQMNTAENFQKEVETGLKKLEEDWGPHNFEGRLELARRAIREQGGDELIKVLDATGLGNNPAMIKFAEKIGKLMVRHGLIVGDGAGGAVGEDAAKAKIKEIMKDQNHATWKEGPGHKEALEEWGKLHKIAYGT